MLQWIKTYSNQTIKAVILSGLFLGAAFLFFSPDLTLAQNLADPSSTLNQGVQVIQQPLGLASTDIRVIIANIIKVALSLLGIILVVLIMYAGFLWMTAGGNEEQITKSKAMLKNAVIGLAIILSAYSIVWFIFRMLGVGGGGGGGFGVNPPGTQNFRGSGALGQIVKDHYPTRNQLDVPRNTKIIITFRKPIRLEEFVSDVSNGASGGVADGILGNCKTNMTDWRTDCDRIKVEGGLLVNKWINIKRADTGTPIQAAAITAVSSTVGNVSGIFTIVIKPLPDLTKPNGGYLGSPTEEIGYIVHLGSELRLNAEGNPKIFDSSRVGNDYYEWEFTCGTALDMDPPYVDNVFPGRSTATKPVVEVKNSVIQVDFSEPMDPTGMQGDFLTSTGGYYYISGENVFLKSDNSTVPLGTFNLTNGYRTLEFTPSIPCGVNACGGQVYCLPVCNTGGATCKQDNYQLLIKAARTIGANSFEAQPFSGVMDISGNALDGNKNKIVNVATTTGGIFDTRKEPDNDFWNFTIKDEVDLTAPYLTYVYPGLDASFVTAYDDWYMVFSKRMRVEPMYDILIDEIPTPAARGDNIPICKVPRVKFTGAFTRTEMNHCPFLDAVKQDYIPSLDSRIEDAHFNCFYPGQGPKTKAVNKISTLCDGTSTNCCNVTSSPVSESFCCNGTVSNTRTTTASCLNNIPTLP